MVSNLRTLRWELTTLTTQSLWVLPRNFKNKNTAIKKSCEKFSNNRVPRACSNRERNAQQVLKKNSHGVNGNYTSSHFQMQRGKVGFRWFRCQARSLSGPSLGNLLPLHWNFSFPRTEIYPRLQSLSLSLTCAFFCHLPPLPPIVLKRSSRRRKQIDDVSRSLKTTTDNSGVSV